MIFQANEEEITYDMENNQVFIIHLVSGLYYFLDNSAAQIWEWLVNGISTDQIVTMIGEHAQADSQTITEQVQEFVQELQAQGLIIAADAPNHGEVNYDGLTNGFEIPKLQTFADAKQFVGLRPITQRTHLAPAHDHIESEVFDDEALVLNLGRGIYYTLSGPARIIWDGVLRQKNCIEIAADIHQYYEIDPARAEESVFTFVQSLKDEGLLGASDYQKLPAKSALKPPPETPLPFSEPEFQKYTDIQNLLLLDPIHEVEGEIGWPHAADN